VRTNAPSRSISFAIILPFAGRAVVGKHDPPLPVDPSGRNMGGASVHPEEDERLRTTNNGSRSKGLACR
jgi:hypothetical protein